MTRPQVGDFQVAIGVTRKTLAAVEELTETLWTMPYSSRVDSITNFQHTRAEEDELVVEDLVLDAELLSDRDISRIKQIATTEPSLVNNLISPSGHVTGVNVNILLPGKSMDEAPEIAKFARMLEKDFHKNTRILRLILPEPSCLTMLLEKPR